MRGQYNTYNSEHRTINSDFVWDVLEEKVPNDLHCGKGVSVIDRPWIIFPRDVVDICRNEAFTEQTPIVTFRREVGSRPFATRLSNRGLEWLGCVFDFDDTL